MENENYQKENENAWTVMHHAIEQINQGLLLIQDSCKKFETCEEEMTRSTKTLHESTALLNRTFKL